MLGPRGLEYLSTLSSCAIIASLLVSTRAYFCRMLGYDVADVTGMEFPAADATFALYVTAAVSATHFALPVRWKVFLAIEFVALVVYGYGICFLGNSTDQLLLRFAGFMVLLTCSSAGLRRWELQERQMFLMLLKEKEMRFQAEYNLERMVMSGGDPHAETTRLEHGSPSQLQGASRAHSVHSTICSAQAFDLLDADLPRSLERLVRLGLREQWLLSPSELLLLRKEPLGCGGFGLVMAGRYQGNEVAVKTAKLPMDLQGDMAEQDSMGLQQLCNELRLLRRLRHPNIVTVYGACLDTASSEMALVLELLVGCTLSSFLSKSPGDAERVQLLVDVAAALAYLHGRAPPIVHGDLKGTNVFVDHQGSRGRGKLLDFGLSTLLGGSSRLRGGSLHWMAPELLSSTATPSSDIYSFGRLVFHVVTGSPPNSNVSQARVQRALVDGRPLPLNWPSSLRPLADRHRDLAERCCRAQPSERASLNEVCAELCAAQGWLGALADGVCWASEEARAMLTEARAAARPEPTLETRRRRGGGAALLHIDVRMPSWSTLLAGVPKSAASAESARSHGNSSEDAVHI